MRKPIKHFLLIVEGDITPIIFGPFKNAAMRDERAVIEKQRRGDRDGIFRLQVQRDRPAVVPYQAYELLGESRLK
jgi:hypothetical protein